MQYTAPAGAAVVADPALSVASYGAVADATVVANVVSGTDNTAAFQAALNAAAPGNTVYVPSGNYAFSGKLNVPIGVSLVGTYRTQQTHYGYRFTGVESVKATDGGSCLIPTGFAGTTTVGNSFITLNTNSSLIGVCIFHGNTNPATTPPVAYPPAIAMRGCSGCVERVELLCPYIGIDINNVGSNNNQLTQRCSVRDVIGQAIFKGLVIGTANDDGTTSQTSIGDIPRFDNIHWNPTYTASSALFTWQQANGYGYQIGDVAEIQFKNCFAYGYNVGINFTQNTQGGPYGVWLGGGIDTCNACVYDQLSQPSFSFRFMGTNFIVGPSNANATILRLISAGDLIFSGCTFQNNFSSAPYFSCPSDNEQVTIFSGCTFRNYPSPCLSVAGGKVIVNGCLFGFASGNTTIAQSGSGIVLATSNMVQGGMTVTGSVTVANNVSFT